MKRSCIAALALILAALPLAGQSPPGADLQFLISIQDDGSAITIERLQLPADMRQPLRWSLPTDNTTPVSSRRWYVDVLEVTDGHGNKLQYTLRQYMDSVEVEIPPQALALSTARISYLVRNAVQFRTDRDELLWTLANAWGVKLQSVSGTVMVPESAVGQFTVRAFAGNDARALPAQGRSADWALEYGSKSPLLDVIFPPGILHRPGTFTRLGWFLDANPIVFFPLLVLLLMLAFRRWAQRNQPATIVPRYEPPAELTPAEAGVLIDGHLDARDVAATMLDLAVRGFMKIEPCTPDEGVEYAGQDFILRLLKPMGPSWTGLKPYEESMIFHTFYGGTWTKLSSVSLRFYSVVPSLETQIRIELDRKGLYEDPRHTHARRQLWLVFAAFLLWVFQATGLIPLAQTASLGALCITASVVIIFLGTRGLHHRTRQGSRVLNDLQGFQQFLDTVDSDRLERLTPDMLEKFLPFAVALGVEHHWTESFSHIATGKPEWFESKDATDLIGMVHYVGWFARAAGSLMLRSPRAAAVRPPSPPPDMQKSAQSAPSSGA